MLSGGVLGKGKAVLCRPDSILSHCSQQYISRHSSGCAPLWSSFLRGRRRVHSQDFISSTIMDRFRSGSLLVWWEVGSVGLPYLLLAFAVEPMMCHNDLFLTLWLKDLPSSLETTSSTLHTTSLSRIFKPPWTIRVVTFGVNLPLALRCTIVLSCVSRKLQLDETPYRFPLDVRSPQGF